MSKPHVLLQQAPLQARCYSYQTNAYQALFRTSLLSWVPSGQDSRYRPRVANGVSIYTAVTCKTNSAGCAFCVSCDAKEEGSKGQL